MGLAAALVAAVAALCWWTGVFEREPSYQGKSATQWLESTEDSGDWAAATAAFRSMGPKGVRFLARTLEAKPVELPGSIKRFINSLDLPDWANPARRIESRTVPLYRHQQGAVGILPLLGRDAEPALPALVRLFWRSDLRQSEGVVDLMVPMADKLGFMVPELIKDLRQNYPKNGTLADIRLLAAIGPKAKDAVPVLSKIAQSGDRWAEPAAVALWNVARETNELMQCISDRLRGSGDVTYNALSELRNCVPPPQPMIPLLESALRHPMPRVRQDAASLLEKIDPERLRRIAEELNSHQAELFQEHLKLLESSNYLDRFNAIESIQFMGPQATSAVPRLAQIIFLGKPMFVAIRALREIGHGASSVTPVLIGLFQTNTYLAPSVFETLSSFGADAAAAIPALRAFIATNAGPARFQAVLALAAIDPGDTNAVAILREPSTSRPHYWEGQIMPIDPMTRLSASVSLWKLGLETNPPVDELVAHATNYNGGWALDLLGDIGPPARRALPSLEQNLDPLNPRLDIAIAIRKIDPEEAKRLGLPGLLIICPDKY
jgi:HEAT repeat protein